MAIPFPTDLVRSRALLDRAAGKTGEGIVVVMPVVRIERDPIVVEVAGGDMSDFAARISHMRRRRRRDFDYPEDMHANCRCVLLEKKPDV